MGGYPPQRPPPCVLPAISLIDRHPSWDNVWLIGAGSGHGFKHGPAVGRHAAGIVTGSAGAKVEPRFSLQTKLVRQQREVH